ncbi:MAG: terpene cyclase/mutase family protein [Planctomycetota bacterium]|nr:terpene cyclase/mutase family protein [Planctomycetota bacterium]
MNASSAQMELALFHEKLRDFVEGSLSETERQYMIHLVKSNAECREAYNRRRQLVGIMDKTLGSMNINPGFDERASQRLSDIDQHLERLSTPGLGQEVLAPEEATVDKVPLPWAEEPEGDGFQPVTGEEDADELAARRKGPFWSMLGAAPWWAVSGAFHGLLILLLTLVSMAILRARDQNTVIVTDLSRAQEKEEEKVVKQRDIFKQVKVDSPTEEIVEQPIVTHEEVEIADHVETANDSNEATAQGDENAISDVQLGGTGTIAAMGLGGGGGGAFGQRVGGGRRRLAVKNGGGRDTESAVDKGLEWLARNQEPDGRWDHAKHGGKHQGVVGDAAMTGYALLAFLGAGHTEKVGKYKENVRKGVAWLIENMGKDQGRNGHEGRWCHGNYTQGIATMALCEAAGMGRVPATKEAAQKAVDGVDFGQIKRGGESDREAWDYGPNGKTNDSSVMAWNVMALKSAKVAGLTVDPAAFEGTITWLNAGQDLGNLNPTDPIPETDWEGGRMAYRGSPGAVEKGKGSHAVMAAAALCRMHIAGATLDQCGVGGPLNIVKNRLLPKKYPFNLYFGYYATLGMFQAGGEHWKLWNEAMKGALLPGQRKGGPEDGSWDPTGAGADEGRVMSTALAVMCLEVYYRYMPLYRD